MNVYFNLTLPKKDESPIRVVISHNGKKYMKSVGISTPTKSWNGKRTGNTTKDSALRLIRVGLESTLDEFATERQILDALDRIDHGRWMEVAVKAVKHRPSFFEYFDEWASRENAAKRQRKNTLKLILKLMGGDADWEDITSAYYLRLVQKMNADDYSKNYQGSVIAKLKTVMSEGYKLKYHHNEDFRDFARPSNDTDAVALTQEELDRVWAVELTDELERKARDMFIIGCYTGARWGDFSQFTKANIEGKEFHYIQHKTGARVAFPVSPRLKEALKRNGWHSPDIGDVVFNRTIKTVCMRAKVNAPIEVRRSKGEKYEHETVPKWKLVSSHTCRRTMCTLLHKAGVPHRELMMVSGHTNLASLERYLRQTDDDLKKTLAKVTLFK